MNKKLFWAFLCLATAVSCSNDDDKTGNDVTGNDSTEVNSPTSIVNVAKYIEGEWIMEIHGEVGDKQVHGWENINFTSTTQAIVNRSREEYAGGNRTDSTGISNSALICAIDDEKLTLKSNTGNDRMLTITNINEVAFEATENETTVMYSHILGTKIEIGEDPQKPDYQSLLPEGTTIKGYASANLRVVNVDATGQIVPVASGKTYVYVETDKGTAAVRVEVKRLFETDYAALIGKTKAVAETTLGNSYIEKDGKMIYSTQMEATFDNYYQRDAGNWTSINAVLDSDSNISELMLTAREEAWFTSEQMTERLATDFTTYVKASDESKKVFLNASQLKEATLRIIWDTEKRTLTFAPNITDIVIGQEQYLPDYEGLLGNGITITGYSTENPYIATADDNGTITGIDSGTTNIVVNTDKGMQKIPVTVHVFLAKGYESLLGGGRMVIIDMFGTVPSTDWDNDDYDQMLKFNSLSFPQQQREVGNWETIEFKMANSFLGPITEILLTPRSSVWFNDAQMIDFLKEKYVYAERLSTAENIFFVNNKEDDLVSASYVWNTNNHTLTIAKFTFF